MGDAAPSREGEVLADKYLLQRRLGIGGMGEVYLAENQQIQRPVAIKLLLPEQAAEQEVAERFLQEARAANLVRHPNVVDVLDFGKDANGVPFIVQEYLEGQDLDTVLAELRGRLTLESALELLLPVVEAIGFAHAKGVVHRDLKPSNVFLARMGTKLVPKVLDFGIAKVTKGTQPRRVTATGVALGTPAYMAPEVIRQGARQADARSDVWSLGVLSYEVFSGVLPFDSETIEGLFAAICMDEPKPLRDLCPTLPKEMEQAIARCLAKDPEQRFANATLVAREFGAILDTNRHRGREHTMRDFDRLVREATLKVTARAKQSPNGALSPAPQQGPTLDLPAAALPAVPDLVLEPPPKPVPVDSTKKAQSKPPLKITVDRSSAPKKSPSPIPRAPARVLPNVREPAIPRAPAQADTSDRPVGGYRPLLALFAILSLGAWAAVVGAESLVSLARTHPHYSTTALGSGAAVVALLGLMLLRWLRVSSCSRLGPLLTGGGVLGFGGMLGLAALQSAGAGLPNLVGMIAPLSLGCTGIGVMVVGSGRAWDVWKADRNGWVSSLFVLATLAGAALVANSVAAMLKLY